MPSYTNTAACHPCSFTDPSRTTTTIPTLQGRMPLHVTLDDGHQSLEVLASPTRCNSSVETAMRTRRNKASCWCYHDAVGHVFPTLHSVASLTVSICLVTCDSNLRPCKNYQAGSTVVGVHKLSLRALLAEFPITAEARFSLCCCARVSCVQLE